MHSLDFNIREVHKYFSVNCFNQAWDLISKADRTSEEDEQMVSLSIASYWHWTQRDDFEPKNASIAYWQISRVYALIRDAGQARKYGRLCLSVSEDNAIGNFYMAYAYEALARAEAIAGDSAKMDEYLTKARGYTAKLSDRDEQSMLEEDITTVHI